MCSNRSARVCAGEKVVVEVLSTSTETAGLLGTGEPTSTFTQLLSSEKRYFSSKSHVYLWIREGKVF